MTGVRPSRIDSPPRFARQAELRRAIDLCAIGEGLRIVGIEAPGGMGKTMLLTAVRHELRAQGRPVALVDLAHPDTSLPLALERRILGQFEFLRETEAGQRVERIAHDYVAAQGTASAETVHSLLRLAAESAVTAINDHDARVVILVDTVDRWVANTTAFRRLTALLPQLRNGTVILAGRATWEILPPLPPGVTVDRSLSLAPLEVAVADIFFTGLEASPELQVRLVRLTEGRPILLRLCAQWLAAGMPLPDASVDPLLDLDTLDASALEDARTAFRRGLVEGIRQLRGEQDVLILEMAHLEHRFNADIVRHLHPEAREDPTMRWTRCAGFFSSRRSERTVSRCTTRCANSSGSSSGLPSTLSAPSDDGWTHESSLGTSRF